MTVIGTFCGKPWHDAQQPLPAPQQCPHCYSDMLSYRRTLSGFHIQFMQALVRLGRPASKKDLVLPYTAKNTGHLAYLWGFVASQSSTGRGHWVVTEAGLSFLQGARPVPPFCVAAGLTVRWYEGLPISLHQVAALPLQYANYRQQAQDSTQGTP